MAVSLMSCLAPWRSRSRSIYNLRHRPNGETLIRPFSTDHKASLVKKMEDVMPIATGLEREEFEAELLGRKRFDMDPPEGSSCCHPVLLQQKNSLLSWEKNSTSARRVGEEEERKVLQDSNSRVMTCLFFGCGDLTSFAC